MTSIHTQQEVTTMTKLTDEQIDSDERWPYLTPAESDAKMFIQWKGTDLCMDFYCTCGVDGHVDSYFCNAVKCQACGQVYELGTQVIARKVTQPYVDPIVLEVD